jgi:hypothetical protein
MARRRMTDEELRRKLQELRDRDAEAFEALVRLVDRLVPKR